jgi:hypothetical protein
MSIRSSRWTWLVLAFAMATLLSAVAWFFSKAPVDANTDSVGVDPPRQEVVERGLRGFAPPSLPPPAMMDPGPGTVGEDDDDSGAPVTATAPPLPPTWGKMQEQIQRDLDAGRKQALEILRDEVASFAYDAVLDNSEQDELEAIVIDEHQRTWQALDDARTNREPGSTEEQLQQIREETEVSARALLDDHQYELYLVTFRTGAPGEP